MHWLETYKDNLFIDMSTVDSTTPIFGKPGVTHHCILLLSIGVVHRYNQWVVVFYRLCKLESRKIIDIKVTFVERDCLIHSLVHAELLDVIVSVWCVEHFRGVV